MNTNWTPGPWVFVPAEYLSHDAPGIRVVVADGGIVGGPEDDPHWVVQGADSIDWAANAHLICAAPDLYAALENLCDWTDRENIHPVGLYNAGRFALEKARGEA